MNVSNVLVMFQFKVSFFSVDELRTKTTSSSRRDGTWPNEQRSLIIFFIDCLSPLVDWRRRRRGSIDVDSFDWFIVEHGWRTSQSISIEISISRLQWDVDINDLHPVIAGIYLYHNHLISICVSLIITPIEWTFSTDEFIYLFQRLFSLRDHYPFFNSC